MALRDRKARQPFEPDPDYAGVGTEEQPMTRQPLLNQHLPRSAP